MTPLRVVALGLLLFAAAIPACDCGEGQELGRVVARIEVDPTAIDFGEVPLLATRRAAITVKNTGTAELTINGADTAAPYSVQVLTQKIPPSGTGVIDVAFTPSVEEPSRGMVQIASNDEANPTVTVTLIGKAKAGLVEITPTSVDLDGTPVGSMRGVEVVVSNRGLEPVTGRILPEAFVRPEHWSLTSLQSFASPGPFSIPARGELKLDLIYRPLAPGIDNGHILFELCGDRCGVELEVLASSADATIRLEPPAVDFGKVGIGQTKTEQIVVRNGGANPIELSRATIAGAAEMKAVPTRALPVTLEGGSSLGINVEFSPTKAVESTATLIVETSDPAVPMASVRMVGQGEGPAFEVEPPAIDFGVMRRPGTYRRPLLLINSGSADVRVERLTISGDAKLALVDTPGLPARLGAGESITAYVAFTPMGMGTTMGNLVVETDDPSKRMVNVPLRAGYSEQQCDLTFTPGRLNFGFVAAGTSRSLKVRINNSGTRACRIVSGAFDAPADPAFRIDAAPWPLMLSPNQSQEIQFTYAPAQQVDSKSLYVARTDETVFPERPISLVGTAAGYPDLFIQPNKIDFGSVRPGCNAGSRTVTLFNGGTAAAEVTRATLTTTTAELRFTRAPIVPGGVVAGGSWSTDIGYTPSNVGNDRAELEIEVRDRPFPFIVPVRGSGATRPRIKDQFQQQMSRKVDVLFVVDDSCSMTEEQAQLAQNFRYFIMNAAVRQVDFRLGLVTTTVFGGASAGRIRGAVLGPSTPNLEAVFAQQASVGTGGSFQEQGLEAMYTAFQAADRGLRPNTDLFRADAALVVIIVSDEDDQSPGPPVFYYNDLRRRAKLGFVVALVYGGPGGCFTSMGSADAAPLYTDFLRLTQGVSESICSLDWARTLTNIGNAAFGLRHRFVLSVPADTNNSVVVTVNGSVPPTTSWSYDPADNAVVFRQGMAPPEGAQIEIEYTPRC